MVTLYESDVSHWEDWQKEYRFGVLLIFPLNPLLAQVNALRTKYDPQSQSACDAHISLTIPLPRPMSEAHWRELESIISTIKSFPIQYGPLMNFLPHPGVCLRLEQSGERVNALCSTDGEQWFTVGHVDFPIADPLQVGLHAIGMIDRLIYPGAYPDGTAIRFESFTTYRGQ